MSKDPNKIPFVQKTGSIVADCLSQVTILALLEIMLSSNKGGVNAIVKDFTPKFDFAHGHASPLNHLASCVTRKVIQKVAESCGITPEDHHYLYKGVAVTSGLIGGALKAFLNNGLGPNGLEYMVIGGVNAALYEYMADRYATTAAIEGFNAYLISTFINKGSEVNVAESVIKGATVGMIFYGLVEVLSDSIRVVGETIYHSTENISHGIFGSHAAPELDAFNPQEGFGDFSGGSVGG